MKALGLIYPKPLYKALTREKIAGDTGKRSIDRDIEVVMRRVTCFVFIRQGNKPSKLFGDDVSERE